MGIRKGLIIFLLVAILAFSAFGEAKKKVILDTDMVFGFDDGICMVMLAQAPNIDLLGVITNYAHNYVTIEAAAGIRQLEMIGKADEIPVFMGCPYPIMAYRVINEEFEEAERTFLGQVATKANDEPASYEDYVSNPDNFSYGAPVTPVQEENGVTWLIETIRENPNEVTVIAIGSMTNIAAAITLAPDIVPLVKEICYMSSSFDIPGNITPAAEYNIWYDPEAAKAVYRAPWNKQVFNSLDIDQYYKYTKEVHDKIVKADLPITRMLDEMYGQRFADDPDRLVNIWDLLSAAYVIDPTLFTEIQERYVDVDTNYGLNYGRTVSWQPGAWAQSAPGTQLVDVLWDMDEEGFWDLFTELVTAPIEDPVNPNW
jgi:inosine-uridine nucleoside N-ribohydrolase